MAAGATDRGGKPVYKRYEKFFNKELEEQKLSKEPSRKFEALSRHLKEKQNGNK